ncbi:IS4 family transposase, partial [Nitrolancea hollandica]|uniref:IS4 family transposase n=1 Tax=Nitrolancea hollandica TaxID=1206749 RepID=UPI00126753E7
MATALPADPVVGDIEAFLLQTLADLEPEPQEPKPGRPRILPALALWAGLLVCVLRGFSSQLALWRLLSQDQLWFYPRFPVSDQAVYTRLAHAGTAPLEQLFAQLTAVLAERLAPYAATKLAPFAAEVVAVDETTLDPVARKLPALRDLPSGAHQLLPGKLAGLFDLRRQQWRQLHHIPDPAQNEKVLARDLVATVPPGSLLLADLGYFGFPWFDEMTEAGYFWISRLRAKTSYTVIHAFYQQGETFDGLIWLGAYRADQAKHAVRLIQFRQGGTLHRYITNVRDPWLLPLPEVARLYARRWDIEMAVQLVKQHLGLRLLWSAKPGVIQQQVWAVLIIAQILQALRLEIAGRAGVDPFQVSLPLLVEYLPRWAYTGRDPVALVVERGKAMGLIRPSRRTMIQSPTIDPAELVPAPAGLILIRKPRYAQR